MRIQLIGRMRPEMQMRVGVRLSAKLRNQQRHRRYEGDAKLNLSAQSFQKKGHSLVARQ